MTDHPSHNLGDLDIEMARRIDVICRRFEADWRAGRRPRIEDSLDDVPEALRPVLRAELIALECELRPADKTITPPETGAATPAETRLDAPSAAEAPTIAPAHPPIRHHGWIGTLLGPRRRYPVSPR